jgi:hypothetical protein
MTNTFSFISQRNVLVTFLLAGFFFLVGLNNTNAQQAARGTANPYPEIAESFDVTAYDLGHFDPASSVEALTAIMIPLKATLEQGGTHADELKYAYLSGIVSDVEGSSIAVEISLLTRLEGLKTNKHLGGTSNQVKGGQYTQLTNLYNSTVSSLQ